MNDLETAVCGATNEILNRVCDHAPGHAGYHSCCEGGGLATIWPTGAEHVVTSQRPPDLVRESPRRVSDRVREARWLDAEEKRRQYADDARLRRARTREEQAAARAAERERDLPLMGLLFNYNTYLIHEPRTTAAPLRCVVPLPAEEEDWEGGLPWGGVGLERLSDEDLMPWERRLRQTAA